MKPPKPQAQPRPSRFNRFQTASAGIRFVRTAVDAHFDPYTETEARPALSNEQMEQVARIAIPSSSRE